jgi:hypothetical protein
MQRLLTALAVIGGLAAAGSAPASAGGWAVTTLDALESPRPREQVDVGFTIRRHGVTPVAVDGVRILVTDGHGVTESFTARSDGPVGHYVAAVTFPAAGSYRWSVEQGWFGPQDLGTVRVGAGVTAVDPGADRWPLAWRAALPLLAVALVVAAAVDRRRRVHATA